MLEWAWSKGAGRQSKQTPNTSSSAALGLLDQMNHCMPQHQQGQVQDPSWRRSCDLEWGFEYIEVEIEFYES